VEILDNLENAWDEDFQFESKSTPVTDAMGREVFWENMGRLAEESEKENLSFQVFSKPSCLPCECNNE
jgi:hypothetical protein